MSINKNSDKIGPPIKSLPIDDSFLKNPEVTIQQLTIYSLKQFIISRFVKCLVETRHLLSKELVYQQVKNHINKIYLLPSNEDIIFLRVKNQHPLEISRTINSELVSHRLQVHTAIRKTQDVT